MSVQTHTPQIEKQRKTLLGLLAEHYPAQATQDFKDKEFHRWLKHYGVAAGGKNGKSSAPDDSNPYIHVDMSQCISCFRCVRVCDEVQGQRVWQVWNRGDATRILPDSGTDFLSSSCVSCGACVEVCPTGALEDKSLVHSHQPTEWTRTTCAYCGTGCELYAGTDQGRLIAVRPVPDAPVNHGHLCSKGRYAFDFVHAPDRISHPMLRSKGKWLPVNWDEAIAATVDALQTAVRTHGPDSIGVLGSARATNEEAYLTQKFARLVLGTNNVDCCARVCHAPSAAALKQLLGTGAATNSFDDIEKARCILVCGCNPTENHPVVGARIKQAAFLGAQLIVIDPRQIELSRYAAVHLQLRPGTNIPLLHAMAHVIVEEGLCNVEALKGHIANWEQFNCTIQRWTPEAASEICGVAPELIRKAARIYACSDAAMCFHGLGLTEHTQGTESVMCLTNLALLTGNLGKPGSGVNPLRGQNNVQGAAHMGCEPALLTGSLPLAAGAAIFEGVWSGKLPASHGLNLMQMLDAAEDGRLSVLWSIGYDVLMTNPNIAASRRAFQRMDAVIVEDLFLNQTARDFGTIFLPACSSFEKDGTFMNAERRIQRIRRVLPHQGESRADWEILCLVAQAMGHGAAFAFKSPRDIWEEIRKVWPAGAGITYERIEPSGLQWPCPDESHPGTAILHQNLFENGRSVTLHCAEFNPSLETTTKDYPFTLITGRTLQQFNAGTMTGHGGHLILRETDLLDISSADAGNLSLCDGDRIRLVSRYGQATLPVHVTATVPAGLLFATFHDAHTSLNCTTGSFRDPMTGTPEYKVTAVRIEGGHTPRNN